MSPQKYLLTVPGLSIPKEAFAPNEDHVHLWKDRFDLLPEDWKNALFFFALHAAPMRLIRIQELCGCLQVEPDPKTNKPIFSKSIIRKFTWHQANGRDCIDKLLNAGWIESPENALYSCKSAWREQIVQFLYESGQYDRYADILFSITGGRYFYSRYQYSVPRLRDRPRTAGDLIRELRHILIDNDTYAMVELFHYAEQYREIDFFKDIHELLATHGGFNWLSICKPETRCRAIQYLLRRCLSLLEPVFDDKWDILCETLSKPGCDPATQILILDYALCTGKLNDTNLDKIDGNLGTVLCQAHQTFLSGNYAEASGLYRDTLKAAGHLSKVKNATLPFLSGIFHALAELHGGNRLSVLDCAKTAIEKADYANRGIDVRFPMSMQGCWSLIQTIGQRLTGSDPGQLQINTTTQKETRPVWLSLLLSAYESLWFNLAPTEAVEKHGIGLPKDCETSFPWAAAEAVEVCESLKLTKHAAKTDLLRATEFRRKSKTIPLRNFIQPREDWQLWLESLQTLAEAAPRKPKKKAEKTVQPKSRLIWRITFKYGQIDFMPCEQKWNAKSESWGQEKTITLSRLYKGQGKMSFLTEQDRKICAAIKVVTRSGYYSSGTDYKFKDNAALEFVGHPLLFSGNSTTSIEMVASGPEISMVEKGGKLHVSFSPPLVKFNHTGYKVEPDDSYKDFFVVQENLSRIKVIKLSKTEMQIRKILGEKGREFPKQAERSLAALLGKLATEDMNVKTDAKIEFADVPEIPCDSKLYLYLAPNGDGLQTDFFVRPLGPDGPTHRTGTGSERILGSIAGKNVQTLRNLDEAQAIKNPDSNRAKAATRLRADFRLAMTGTPIENSLVELWSLFRFLNPGLLGSQKSFEDRFAIPIQRDHASGPRNTLRRLMQPLILRRTKSQVLEELPPRTEIVREIEMSRQEAALYEAARLNALSDLEKIKDANAGKNRLQILAALTRLRQLCCNPKLVLPKSEVESSKLGAFREIMHELKENRHKVLVFSQFVKHLDLLRAELDEMGVSYQYLDGSTPARERQKRVDAFQEGDYDAFLISIKAGGSGLNLTAADYVIHMDPWWNPAVEDQATDRTHRIGQTRPVTVYRLITQGTIEEKIVRLHHEKRDIADKLLEGTDQATKLTADELIDILRS